MTGQRIHALSLAWEDHKRLAREARDQADHHEREASRIWADLRLMSQSASEGGYSAKSGAAATHGAATHVGRPAWRTEPEGA